MRQGMVLYNGEVAGTLQQDDAGQFSFCYDASWAEHPDKPAISLTLPKQKEDYRSPHLFPFFFNLLPEGTNRRHICQQLRLDQSDDFGLLLAIAGVDTIGAVRVQAIVH